VAQAPGLERRIRGQLLHRIGMFIFALIALFFLYRDGPWIGFTGVGYGRSAPSLQDL